MDYDEAGHLRSRRIGSEVILYEYDDQGNLLRGYTQDGDLFRYTWDARGRLISATTIENGVSSVVQYLTIGRAC